MPYTIDDAGDTTTPAYTVSSKPWFNYNIYTFLNNNKSFGTGNWDYEGDLGEYNLSSEPEIINPFNTSIPGGICGSMKYNITGYHRKHY